MSKTGNKNDAKLQALGKGFYTPPPKRNSRPPFSPKSWMSEKKIAHPSSQLFHVLHKVPLGHSPYVKAKHVQLIEKDPNRAVALFWNAINSGDRIDSALKDMAVVMKQLDRSNEAIEAIKSFRHLCSSDSQESLDNVLVELYKHSGRLEEQIEVLQLKLKRVEEGNTSGGKRVKVVKSQGKKVHITVEQEYARLLGNLAWAYLQQNDHKTAEEYYRKALSIEQDRNKQCNLAICLICMNRITEAKILLQVIRTSAHEGRMDESYAKSFERASELLAEIESQPDNFLFEAEKENHCGNAGMPYESIRNNRRVSDDQLDLKDEAYGALDANFNSKRLSTPSVQAGGIPKSPCTQPKRSLSLFDQGKWKGTDRKYGGQPDLKGVYSEVSFAKSNIGSEDNINVVDASASYRRPYIPSVQAQGIPNSPCTQPKKSLSPLSCGTWKNGTYRNKPVSCLPRRLQFEKPVDLSPSRDLKSKNSETDQHGSVNMINLPMDSTPVTKVSDKITPDVDRKENLYPKITSGAGIEGDDSCNVHNDWVSPSYNCQKSWADIVEEDEQEMMHMHLLSGKNGDLKMSENVESSEENLSRKFQSVSLNEVASKQSSACQSLFSNQQQKQEPMKYKRSNRLQVFQDLTPE